MLKSLATSTLGWDSDKETETSVLQPQDLNSTNKNERGKQIFTPESPDENSVQPSLSAVQSPEQRTQPHQ